MKALEIGLFALCALVVIGGGLTTIAARRPVRSALGLLGTIFGVAGCYLLLSAQFLAAIQLVVYAGAVVVLFVFVVMLLGSAATSAPDARSAIPRYTAWAVFLASAIGALALLLGLAEGSLPAPPTLAADFGTIERLGQEIFTRKIVPFELTGALLLVAVVGAMAVARGKHRDPTRRAPGAELATSSPPAPNPEAAP